MKLKIKRNILLENLNLVNKAVSSRNIIPVLNGIKFNLTEEGLYLTASDNDVTIESFINKKDIKNIKEKGSLIIYGKYILEIIRKLPDEEIEIEERDGNKVIISTENSKYNLNCFNLNDFPNINFDRSEEPLIINMNDFKKLINDTIFAVSYSESRPLLTGINFKIIGNLIECIATDSYRLSKRTYTLDKIFNQNINIVLPARNIIELIKISSEEDENIEIHIFNNKVLFIFQNVLYQSSLLNGTYPNTDNSIPTEFNIEIELNKTELYNAIDRASLLGTSKDKNIIELINNDNLIKINSFNQEIGKVEEKLIVNKIKGEDIKISFSARYMLEALKIFEEEKLILLLNGEIKPIIIKSPENNDLIELILPYKTF